MLITLAIIGIVAALTIPTLVANYQKKQYVTGLQKAISNTSQAFKLILADEGVDNLSQTSVFQAINDINAGSTNMSGNQSEFVAMLGKYLKISDACINPAWQDADSGCSSPVYKNLLGDDEDEFYKMYGRVKLYLNDGMVYYIRASKTPFNSNTTEIALIEADINGDKGPNILGRDCFSFNLLNNGQIVLPGSKYWNELNGSDNYFAHWSESPYIETCGYFAGGYCAARIFENGWKMDY